GAGEPGGLSLRSGDEPQQPRYSVERDRGSASGVDPGAARRRDSRGAGQANPAAYLSDLAMSLNNLANRLSETGDRQAALTPARRAVEIREELAPAAYLSDLAMSFGTLGGVLRAIDD